MIYFVLDACALARIYVPDIGTRNLLQIRDYPDSKLVVPNLAYSETISALISFINQGLIDEDQYRLAKSGLSADFRTNKVISTEITDADVKQSEQLLERHKRQPGRMRLSGADSLYLALASRISPLLKTLGGRVILVTSDGALYDSALADPEIEAFHFWTCDMGCRCGREVIPVKGKSKVPNSCPSCGQTCPECRYELCPSTYQVCF
jgi:predicted nucleic acid-binding protein